MTGDDSSDRSPTPLEGCAPAGCGAALLIAAGFVFLFGLQWWGLSLSPLFVVPWSAFVIAALLAILGLWLLAKRWP